MGSVPNESKIELEAKIRLQEQQYLEILNEKYPYCKLKAIKDNIRFLKEKLRQLTE